MLLKIATDRGTQLRRERPCENGQCLKTTMSGAPKSTGHQRIVFDRSEV